MAEEKKKNTSEPEEEESALARRIRSLDGDEALRELDNPDEILCKPKTFRGKASNFWFHFKWPTILLTCLTVTAVILVTQLLTRVDPDIYVMYAGPASLSVTGIDAIESSFEAFDTDYNGDGKHNAALLDLVVYTQAQMDELQAAANSKGEPLSFNSSVIQEARQRFSTEISAGDSVICLLDPHMYQSVHDAGGFLPLSEVFDTLPDGVTAVDDCGILLSSTDFGRNFTGVNALPADTVLCVRRLSTLGSLGSREKTEKAHEYQVGIFKKIVTYTSSAPAAAPAD